MELPKQARAQPALARGSGPASRPLPSAALISKQPANHAMVGPGNRGAQVPTSAYLIVPMGGQRAQVGASSPNAPHLPGARPASRVSLRPPQQVLSVQPTLPVILASPAPSAMGKKVAASPKVQMLNSVPSQVPPASKGFVQKGPLLKAHSQLSDSETVRSKFRENLVAALCVDSDQQIVQKSTGNISAFRSACENKHADGGTLHKPSTCITLNEGKADTGTGPKSVGSISEQHDTLSAGILGSNIAIKVSKDAQEQSIHVCLENDVSGNCAVASDEFLQRHGPLCAPDIVVGASESISPHNSKRATTSDTDDGATVPLNEPEFKRTKTSDAVTWEQKGIVLKGQSLALRIEEDLFKLCGGVSKKYKEKARSLLFNLKDKSNPLLRGRVLSGDITPKCLCSMTTEELASKELLAWRLAKAEELGKMVVRPNREMNIQRLVRKTHKGEFYVEVEETDSISVGDELRGDLLSHIPSKSFEGRIKSDGVSVHRGDMESDNTVQDGFAGIGNSSLLSNLECVANKKAAFIQEKVHDMKYTENLPEIMSLDDFVEAPDSDIPLECHSTETAQDDPNFTDRAFHTSKPEKNHIGEGNAAPSEFEFTYIAPSPQDNCQAGMRSPKNGSIRILSPAKQPKGGLLTKSSPEKMDAEIPDTGCATQSKAISLWEGTIQLNLSSLINVVAIFKSGEKPSTNEWCRFVEIKGRVRLTALQDFLEQLPNSRSRAVTVTELRWKEDSHESGRQQFMQTIDSYIADERVGLVKPAEGVELYICPSQGKTVQVLAEHLPKEHSGILTVTGVPVIGVFVWRRPCVSTQTLTRHEEGSKVQSMPISRKQQAVIATTSVPMSPHLTRPASQFVHPNEHHRLEYDATDDVPPGFGQGVVKDDNDLPVYDCASISNRSLSPNEAMPYSYRRQQHGQAHSPPMDLVRQLVRKYGRMYDLAEPWDRNHDDLPEWDPSLSGRRHNATQQQPVLPSPLSQVYNVPQQHAMTVQRPWNHPAEALSVQPGWWQSRPQWEDIPQWTRLAVEPNVAVPKSTSLRGGAREPWLGSWKRH